MTSTNLGEVRMLAYQAIVSCIAIMALALALILTSIARPIYLWHGSSIMTHDGMRLAINDGVLIVEQVSTSGIWSVASKDPMILSTKVISGSRELISSPEADRAEIQKRQDDPGDAQAGTPRICLLGPSWRNYGGFETVSVVTSDATSRLSLQVLCLPLWLIAAAFGGLGACIGVAMWLTRRQSRERGFLVELINKISLPSKLFVSLIPST